MVSYIVISVICLLLIAADQITKYLVVTNVTTGIDVIPGFFRIVCWENKGAAWGIFSNATAVLAVVSTVVAALVIFAYVQADSAFLKLCLGLLAAGAIGNVIDRIRLGYVTDFLSFYNLFGYEFPAFNVADICVTAGSIGLVIYLIFLSSKKKAFREGTPLYKFLYKEKAEKQEQPDLNEKTEPSEQPEQPVQPDLPEQKTGE